MVNFSSKGPLRELNLRSGQPPSAAHSCATASSSAIALVLPPAAEDAAAAEPSRAAPRRSSRARRAPGTMTTPCLKSRRAAFLRAFVPPRTHPFCQAVDCMNRMMRSYNCDIARRVAERAQGRPYPYTCIKSNETKRALDCRRLRRFVRLCRRSRCFGTPLCSQPWHAPLVRTRRRG